MTNFVELFAQQPTREQLAAAFDDIEADVTYIDDNETVVYFSPFRIFARPESILGHNMYECHDPKIHANVKAMIDSFKAGESDKVTHETHNRKHKKIRVCYQAMRDRDGKYLGCLEAVTLRD